MRRTVWQIIWSLVAAVLSLYVAFLVSRYYGYGSDVYEPKDFERQQLFEQTGRSVIDPKRK
ncbi:MAG: hypothetical protein AB1515_05815 [Nitrospirota bacterium]